MKIIGVDMATQPKKTGLALVDYTARRVVEVTTGDRSLPVATTVDWIGDDDALIAVDAPLGWPAALASSLIEHAAGAPLTSSKNAMFRRRTDELVRERTGKMPLEVGADRIARTAHAALEFLGGVRAGLGRDVEVAWSHRFDGVAAIEVYPAASLLMRGLPSSGYKRARDESVRREILAGVVDELQLDDDRLVVGNADALDAVVAALAGVDFLDGLAIGPTQDETELARTEGWIWVVPPG